MLKALLPLAISFPILLSGCGGADPSASDTSVDGNQSSVTETLANKQLGMNLDLSKLQSVGLAADKIIVTITKGEFTQTIETTHTDYSALVEFSNLVIGEYTIAVEIFDGDTLVAEGIGLGSVTENQIATVNIDLELKSGGLIVNVNVSDPNGSELLTVTKTLITTTDKLDGGPIVVSGSLGSTLADSYANATYNHEAAYTQLEKGSELEMSFGISYLTTAENEIQRASVPSSSLELKYNELTLIACEECESDIQRNADVLTINYNNIDLPEDIANSLVERVSGEPVEIISPTQFTQRLNIEVTFKKIDGNDIPDGDVNSEKLLDEDTYLLQFKLEGKDCLVVTSLAGCVNLGKLSAI